MITPPKLVIAELRKRHIGVPEEWFTRRGVPDWWAGFIDGGLLIVYGVTGKFGVEILKHESSFDVYE